MSLHFPFQMLLDEIEAISRITRGFMAPSAVGVFAQLKANLESIRASKSTAVAPWAIRESYPLQTGESLGQYEPGDGGSHVVVAELTCLWEVACVPDRKHGNRAPTYLSLEGIASTRVRLFDVDTDPRRELAMWRMEVGDNASPGCHFHVQILGEPSHQVFPHSLPVPRFPSIIVTPMAVLEFVLAELFQDNWRQRAAQESADMLRWKPIQQKRWRDLLAWHQICMRDAIGSPWTSFKTKKPSPELFTSS